jgi:hypothetical protein
MAILSIKKRVGNKLTSREIEVEAESLIIVIPKNLEEEHHPKIGDIADLVFFDGPFGTSQIEIIEKVGPRNYKARYSRKIV